MNTILTCLAMATILVACSSSQAPAPAAGADMQVDTAAAEVTHARARPMSVRTSELRNAEDMPRVATWNMKAVNDQTFAQGVPSARRSHTITLVRCLVDDVAKAIPGIVVVRLQSSDDGYAWDQDVSAWHAWPDVAAKYGSDAYVNSGFKVPLSVADLPVGNYAVYTAFPGSDGEVQCGMGRHLQLTV